MGECWCTSGLKPGPWQDGWGQEDTGAEAGMLLGELQDSWDPSYIFLLMLSAHKAAENG